MENKVYWKTQQGLELDIDLMEDTHVRNAFKMLVKQLNEAKKAKCVEEKKIEMNGDMGNEFNDSFYESENDEFNDLVDGHFL